MDRKEFRREASKRRELLTPEERSSKSFNIGVKFMQCEMRDRSGLYLIYVSYKTEVATIGLIESLLAQCKRVACPVVKGDIMEFHELRSIYDLKSGAFGILEPDTEKCQVIDPDAESVKMTMILPGLAFDEAGHRMGYGGGYYDKYLAKYPVIKKTAVCFEAQIFDEVPHQEWDKTVDRIITEDRIININE